MSVQSVGCRRPDAERLFAQSRTCFTIRKYEANPSLLITASSFSWISFALWYDGVAPYLRSKPSRATFPRYCSGVNPSGTEIFGNTQLPSSRSALHWPAIRSAFIIASPQPAKRFAISSASQKYALSAAISSGLSRDSVEQWPMALRMRCVSQSDFVRKCTLLVATTGTPSCCAVTESFFDASREAASRCNTSP